MATIGWLSGFGALFSRADITLTCKIGQVALSLAVLLLVYLSTYHRGSSENGCHLHRVKGLAAISARAPDSSPIGDGWATLSIGM